LLRWPLVVPSLSEIVYHVSLLQWDEEENAYIQDQLD